MPTNMPTDINRRGLMLVLSSPSGAGKTTLSRKLLEGDDMLSMSISVTTRPARPNETDGQDYHFISEHEFKQMQENNALLEHAKVFGHFYGSPREPVATALQAGRDVLFDIDWQGTQQLHENATDDLVRVFIMPPSAPELARRLRERAQDSQSIMSDRMTKASAEISHYAEYDYIIVNEDVEKSTAQLRNILQAERLKRMRQTGLADFVKQLQTELDATDK